MKKYVLLLAAAFTASLACYSQSKNASLKWGPELKGSKRGSITGTVGYDESGYYLKGYERGDVYLEKLDKNLNEVANWEFVDKDPETKQKFDFEYIYYFNDKLLLFQSSLDKETKQNILYVKNVNKKTMVAEGKMTKLAEIAYEKKSRSGGFGVYTSREESKMMIINFPPPADKEANETYGVIVCDSNLNVLWKKTITLPYQNSLFFGSRWKVDDAGNVYLLGTLYKEKVKSKRRGVQNFTNQLLAWTNGGATKTEYEIKLADKFITDISYAISDNGDIICSGYYSKGGFTSVDGCYYLVLDPKSKNTKVSNMKEFGIDFLTQGMSEKGEEKAKKKEAKGKDLELYEYDLHDLILKDDGGCVLIGEQYYVYTRTYSNGKSTYTVTYYNYNDIIVTSVAPDGKIAWSQKIPKRQTTQNDGGFYSSFALAVTKDKLRFIFNDHKDNLAPKKQGDWKNFSLSDKRGIVAVVTMDKDGNITREPLFSDAETEVYCRPKVCDQFNDDQMLLFGERGKKEQFAIITFK